MSNSTVKPTPTVKPTTPTPTPTPKATPAAAPLAPTQVVQLQAKYAACPKRPGTASGTRAAAYWPVYARGGTVAQCMAAGATRADLAWDRKHGFITVA